MATAPYTSNRPQNDSGNVLGLSVICAHDVNEAGQGVTRRVRGWVAAWPQSQSTSYPKAKTQPNRDSEPGQGEPTKTTTDHWSH